MQHNYPAEIAANNGVPRRDIMGTNKALVRAIQAARGTEVCFMTEKRLLCKEEACEWRIDCRRLVAVWRR